MAACLKFATVNAPHRIVRGMILLDPVFSLWRPGAGARLAMRVIPTFATGVLLLVSINVAKAADPTLLAETGAYLLSNASRCACQMTASGRPEQ